MVTIKDVAKRAGVSIATVSHVINATRFVSEELKSRVLKAIEELDYHPSTLASGLRNKKTSSIGLVIPDNSNPLFAELSRVIEDTMANYRFNVLLCNTAYDVKREASHLRSLRAKRVDGIIIVPTSTDAGAINKLIDSGCPVVVMDRLLTGIKADAVLIDNFNGMYEATKHLIKLGHKRIGYIDRPFDLPHSRDRFLGYCKALKDAGAELDKSLVIRGGFTYDVNLRATQKLLKLKSQPTAIIAFNDVAAISAIRAIFDVGLSVPWDISVVGFDDIPQCSVNVPRLTTVHFPKNEMATYAAEALLKRISGEAKGDYKTIILPAHLIIRESTSECHKE